MLRLLGIVAIVAVIIVNVNEGAIISSPRYCGYSSKTSTCPGDDLLEIKFPFWIENRTDDENRDCISYSGFQIKCAANGRPIINISNQIFYVLSINYDHFPLSLTVSDVVVDAQECPQPRRNISIESTDFLVIEMYTNINMNIFYNCSSSHPKNLVQHVSCLDDYYNNSTGRSFAFIDEEISSHEFNWSHNCEETVVVPVKLGSIADIEKPTKMNYTQALRRGFSINWGYPMDCGNCELSGGKCGVNNRATSRFNCSCPDGTTRVDDICHRSDPFSYSYQQSYEILGPFSYTYQQPYGKSMRLKQIIGGSVGAILLLLLVICRRYCYSLYNSIYSSCRRIIQGPTKVEMFLENYGGLYLQSYKYSDIKKMTNSFKDTMGEGGYGSVFKGKLHNGQLVAVKVLNESKGKGDDFINEVATIGKTNHVNVVSLLGFCNQGTERALVYEFMPNGSLEKFIHNGNYSSMTNSFLGWEKLYQIGLGIARGLEYLHRGCNTRILHLDIKPHNILLDQDFCPKISDFGLAKLCTTKGSIVSMVGARGTIGYIAPEVCCPNFGGVSHKSDVYSYGMMVLEMIGGRKNIDVTVEHTSEIYFPQWIYKRLRGNIQVEGSEKNEVVVSTEIFEEETAQKMIRVALWCIQAHPVDRPSMTKVVDMLEGNIEELQLPPNPFPDPSSKPFPSSS